jgi:hypothetical protein
MRGLTKEELSLIAAEYSEEDSKDPFDVYGEIQAHERWWTHPVKMGQFIYDNFPSEFNAYNQWYISEFGSPVPINIGCSVFPFEKNGQPTTDDIVVRENENKKKFLNFINRLQALDPDVDIQISGDKDERKTIHTSACFTENQDAIYGNSKELNDYGLLVDFYVNSSVISDSQIQQAAIDSGFGNLTDLFTSGHVHLNTFK